jgi:hypothetical protein
MTKKQKIWLGVFLAMFLVSEILWGALLNAVTSLVGIHTRSIYNNLVFFSDYPWIAFLIIALEIFAVFGIIYIVYKFFVLKNLFLRFFILFFLSFVEIGLLFLLYFNYSISNISF